VHVVLNGNLTISPLRKRLEGRGPHVFGRSLMAEVIVHAYEEAATRRQPNWTGCSRSGALDSTALPVCFPHRSYGRRKALYHAGPANFSSSARSWARHPRVPRRAPSAHAGGALLSRYLLDFECIIPGAVLDARPTVANPRLGTFLTVSPAPGPRLEQYWTARFGADDSLTETTGSRGLPARNSTPRVQTDS